MSRENLTFTYYHKVKFKVNKTLLMSLESSSDPIITI